MMIVNINSIFKINFLTIYIHMSDIKKEELKTVVPKAVKTTVKLLDHTPIGKTARKLHSGFCAACKFAGCH